MSNDKTVELRLCEQDHLALRPNINYRFTVDPSCAECVKLARVYEESTKFNPKRCPQCGGTDLSTDIATWSAVAVGNKSNTDVLIQHQCRTCEGKSFWT